MAGSFDGSTQYLFNTASPTLAYPFTFAAWVYPTSIAAGAAAIVGIGDAATSNEVFAMRRETARFEILSRTGGSNTSGFISSAVTVNAWHFVVARFISATNRRIHSIGPSGAILSAQNTTSSTATGIDNMGIGCEPRSGSGTSPFGGSIAEVSVWNVDIQADGAVIQDALLRQLAYGGPFSLPHLVKDLQVYRSLKNSLSSVDEVDSDTYFDAPGGVQVWSNTGGVLLAPHPPLPANYSDLKVANRIFGV